MQNFAVVCFVVVGTTVLFVPKISSDNGFWFEEEVHDVEKRQTWDDFYKKHVVEAAWSTGDPVYWNKIAKERFGSEYGLIRKNTFIRVINERWIFFSFSGHPQVCSNGYRKSNMLFDVIELVWSASSHAYTLRVIGQVHICVELNGERQPIRLHGIEY